MSGSLNKVSLIGNLGKDPEVSKKNDGEVFARFSIATTKTWNDKTTGERKEKTEWHQIAIFNTHFASIAEKYLRKGSKVYLEGSLQTRDYGDKNKITKSVTEIVLEKFGGELTMLGSKNDGIQPKEEMEVVQGKGQDLDDEIPF